MPAEHYHSGSNPDLGFIIFKDFVIISFVRMRLSNTHSYALR